MQPMLVNLWSKLLNESIECSAIPILSDGRIARELLRLQKQREHMEQPLSRLGWSRADLLAAGYLSAGTLNVTGESVTHTKLPTDKL